MSETVSNLMEAKLLGVFNERDAQRRALAIESTYASDVRSMGDEGTSVGREALEAKASTLQSQMPGLVFAKASRVYRTRGFGSSACSAKYSGDAAQFGLTDAIAGFSTRRLLVGNEFRFGVSLGSPACPQNQDLQQSSRRKTHAG
jgi:hypothetical protein